MSKPGGATSLARLDRTVSRRRPLVAWLVADTVSLTGTRVSMIAIPLFVLLSTGSATRTGVVAFAELVPLVVVKALSGPLIDRVGARRVAVGCDLTSVAVVAGIPLLADAGRLSFGALLLLVAIAGALRGPGDAAKNALAPQVAATAGAPMERVTGLASTVERTATMAGAALAGVLVAALGPANALFVDAASFGVSALVLLWGTVGLEAGTVVDSRDAEDGSEKVTASPALSYVDQLRDGWRFLRGDRLLLGIATMVAVTNLLDQAVLSVLMPVWAVDSGAGARSLGFLLAVFSGFAAIGALSAAVWAARLPRSAVYVAAFLLAGLPRFVVLAVPLPWWVLLTTYAVSGFAAGFINPILGAVEFERIPPALVGRVSSLVSSMAFALMPLGGLLGGLLVDGAGLTTALLVCGATYLVVTLTPALGRTWRQLDDRPAVSGAGTRPATGPRLHARRASR